MAVVIESAMRWVVVASVKAPRAALGRAVRMARGFEAELGMGGIELRLICNSKCIHFVAKFKLCANASVARQVVPSLRAPLPCLFSAALLENNLGKLTTHVLDTANGCPAGGMAVRLYGMSGGTPVLLKSIKLNQDGRSDSPLLEGAAFLPGRYRLVFCVAAYFRARGETLAEPPFLDEVPLDFGLAAVDQHYHVPLLASAWAYSTYRGS